MSNEEWGKWKRKNVSWDVAAADSETVAATAGEPLVSSSLDSPRSENHDASEPLVSSSLDSPRSENHDASASAESHHTSQSLNPDPTLPAHSKLLPHTSNIHHLLNGPPNADACATNDVSNHQMLGLGGHIIGVNLATGMYGEGDTWGQHLSLMDYLHAPLTHKPDLLSNTNIGTCYDI